MAVADYMEGQEGYLDRDSGTGTRLGQSHFGDDETNRSMHATAGHNGGALSESKLGANSNYASRQNWRNKQKLAKTLDGRGLKISGDDKDTIENTYNITTTNVVKVDYIEGEYEENEPSDF